MIWQVECSYVPDGDSLVPVQSDFAQEGIHDGHFHDVRRQNPTREGR